MKLLMSDNQNGVGNTYLAFEYWQEARLTQHRIP